MSKLVYIVIFLFLILSLNIKFKRNKRQLFLENSSVRSEMEQPILVSLPHPPRAPDQIDPPVTIPKTSGNWKWGNEREFLVLRFGTTYQYHIGAGGCLWKLIGSNPESMIGPPTSNQEQHDRVLQLVIWAVDTKANVTGLTEDDKRWNANQGGGWIRAFAKGNALYSEIFDVELNRDTNAVYVWSSIKDQFQWKLATHFKCDFPLLTVYTPHESGALMIDRYVYYGPCTEQNQNIPLLRSVYMEQWMTSPHARFQRVAFNGVTPMGIPNGVVPRESLPDYPNISASNTAGNLVAYGNGDAMALMWSRSPPNVLNSRSYNEYHKLFALLPAADLGDVSQGSIIRISMAIAAAPDSDLKLIGSIIKDVQPLVRPTLVIKPGFVSVPGLSVGDIARLKGNVGRSGIRTLSLGKMLK